MWKEMFLMNGTIESKDGKPLDVDELIQLLNDNGYEYEGGYQQIKHEDLSAAVQTIADSLTEDSLAVMVEQIDSMYGDMDEADIVLFFEANFGTGSFDQVFEVALDEEMKKLYRKYDRMNWQIADTFGSELGQAVIEKLKK